MLKKSSENKMLFFSLIGLLILIPVIFYFLAKGNITSQDIKNDNSGMAESGDVTEETASASSYFNDIFSKDLIDSKEQLQYYREDPFKTVCNNSSSESNPSVSSNTVCLY